jgi:hypothetical protein
MTSVPPIGAKLGSKNGSSLLLLATMVLLLRAHWWRVIFFSMFVWSVRGDPNCPETCDGVNKYWSGVEGNGTQLLLAFEGGSSSPAVGDVLMIIQMQGGTINNSDTPNYGSNNGTGNGFTDVGLAGQYDFAEVAEVATPNLILNLSLSQSLSFHFSSTGNNRFQAIRVAFCREATVNSTNVPAWNGSVGGVLVVMAERILLGNVSLEGKGFRGGPPVPYIGDINVVTSRDSFRDNSSATRLSNLETYNAPKGEGFIGFPRFPNQSEVTTYPDTLDCSKGAPGNAGGGSTWISAGGGGGANAGQGGNGGRHLNYPGKPGLGGAPAPSNATNRIFLGEKAVIFGTI